MRSRHFRLADYLGFAGLAACGLAIKTGVVPLAQMITGPLLIPGGVVAGGCYMLFWFWPAQLRAKGAQPGWCLCCRLFC